jgi:hypothetical protein
MGIQDYYDPLQVFDYLKGKLDDHKAELGIKFIAQFDEELYPEYPSILLNMEGSPLQRNYHATQMFRVIFNMDIWILHAQLSVGRAVRSRQDVEFATNVRKLLHSDITLGGHIIHGWVDGEYSGSSLRRRGTALSTIVTTRLTWRGENRVPFTES